MIDIFGTLGPSCNDTRILSEMLRAGMTGVRLNLSHITLREAHDHIRRLHDASVHTGIDCKLLIDLQGPELRIGMLNGPLNLIPEQRLDVCNVIPFPKEIPALLTVGQQLLLDDGKILLEMSDSRMARVVRGGILTSRKSVALPGVSVSLPALTETDIINLEAASEYGVTGIMQPFVRSKEDLLEVRSALNAVGGEKIRLYAKIESQTGVDHLPELLPYADEFIIARGDLGNAVTLFKLPGVQKQLSLQCRCAGKPFMVVTQMLASMEHSPVPTRAEVNDIFNSVLDGASSVMVTGETAVGDYPVDTIRALSQTVREAERFLNSGT